jgi:hypothetical protein
MKKTFSLLAAAALVAGCGGGTNITAQEAREALPDSAAIRIETPSDSAATASALANAVGERAVLFNPGFSSTSEYAEATYFTAWTVNAGVVWTLETLKFIVAFQPTSCEDGTCTWGPHPGDDGNSWKLSVTKVEDGKFTYAMSAQPGSAPEVGFVTFLSGTAYPQDPWHGHGSFTIDFDAAAQLDHAEPYEDQGVLAVTYDNRGPVDVAATFLGAKSKEDGQLMNVAYRFVDPGAGGELQVALETVEDVPEHLTLYSRWTQTGAGRGDGHYWTNGLDVTKSECWDGAAGSFHEVYDSSPGAIVGSESLCAFADPAVITIQSPQP